MFSSKRSETNYNDRDIRAFLEHGCEFDGRLTFSGVVRLNGKFKGDIDSIDTLIVGDTAEIEGTICVGAIIIGGRVKGDIKALHRTEILATGKVEAKLSSPVLVTHEGAEFIGVCEVRKDSSIETEPVISN
jgi:cytoskeletal protein CcmA (bactofilin family)